MGTYLDIASIEQVALPADIAEAVGGVAGDQWLEIRAIRRTHKGGQPICVTHSYIPGRLGWLAPEIPDCVGPMYAMIEERTGETIINATQEIRAVQMTSAIAQGLEAAERDPALCLLRCYQSESGTLIASFNWHPGDSFTYRLDMHRKAPGM